MDQWVKFGGYLVYHIRPLHADPYTYIDLVIYGVQPWTEVDTIECPACLP